MTDKKNEEHDDEEYRRYLGLVGIPFVMIATPLCGYFIGYWLDGLFETKPYLTYLFLTLGAVACVREVYKIFKTFGKDD
jgi:F0F1-type ATP synthase assembly protein I